jgi:hypothetical protein
MYMASFPEIGDKITTYVPSTGTTITIPDTQIIKDKELEAIRLIIGALSILSPEEIKRVMDYVQDRFLGKE